ncbi:hypothetical protein BKP45_04660 [Anaerobacillus alkalidiazotrophicus]|uniref:Homoserine dehydrogenase n=1 Tax=Anaerobacillus alkalidiazotrophicus TaxID=472963 RepID=A0A1S2MC04_9BACI|nr:homoserine dehydrogenase [Anaerobacillus alkalidiazotrophicus]OIJ21973.1 hypothetical protein BKP45_04660 [Anaerobacillus alkalidiazotrophicus]
MIKIGFLGFGTVNSGVYEGVTETLDYLESVIGEELCITKILIRNKRRYVNEANFELMTDRPEDFFSNEFDIVFEAMGGEQPALDYITLLLMKKIPVITANKELVAKHGPLLENLASKYNSFIGYEATVAGGIPIVNTLNSQLQWSAVEKVSGILNGTTNYIITKLADGKRSFENVLKEAQQLGFAEADPTADIEGFDALYKLQILCKLCFGAWVSDEQFQRKGMSHLKSWHFKAGEALGLKLKYIAEAYYDGREVQGTISPCFIDKNHPLSAIENENNGVHIKTDWLGDFVTAGPGAGKRPTATSMIEDYLHQLLKKNNQTNRKKRVKAYLPDSQQFVLFYEKSKENEINQKIIDSTYDVEEVLQIDDTEKIAMIIKAREKCLPIFDEIEYVDIFPIQRGSNDNNDHGVELTKGGQNTIKVYN